MLYLMKNLLPVDKAVVSMRLTPKTLMENSSVINVCHIGNDWHQNPSQMYTGKYDAVDKQCMKVTVLHLTV